MRIATTCPNCSAFFRLEDGLAGRTVKCQACASVFVVPTGDKTGTQAGMLVSTGAPPMLAPAAPEAKPAFPAPPPLPPPAVLDAAEEKPVPDAPVKPPPLTRQTESRRGSQEHEPAKSGSRALPWLIGLGALGLLLCFGCTGVSALWVVVPQKAFKKPGVAKKVDGLKDNKDGVAKFERFKDFDKKGVDRFDRQIFPPFLGFKDGRLPAPPPPGPPGSVAVVFGPDGKFSHDGKVTLLDPPNADKKRHKLYVVRMEAGHTYQIDMVSITERFDSYLYLRDSKNQFITDDDDSGGFPNARIVYTPQESGIFHIEASYFVNPDNPNPAGDFRLIVQHVN